MERRKILLGSGAAIATVLAGCSSTDTDNPQSDDQSDDTTESFGDDTGDADGDEDDENGQDVTEGEDDGDDVSEDDPDDTDGSDDEDSQETIPGFDEAEFEANTDDVSVTNVARDDASVTVVTEADTLDEDELNAELESGVLAFADSIDDADAFTEEIDAVPWHLNYNGFNVAVFEIESEWIVEYANGELSEEELEERVLETV